MEPCGVKRKAMEPVSDWSSLPVELLVEIGKLVIKSAHVEDFIGFAGVCTSWRAAARDNECAKLIKSWPMFPLLMLAEKKKKGVDSDEREFYSLSKKKVCMRLSLPHGKGTRLFTESRFGWFLTVTVYKKPELLNPFTGARFALPVSTNKVNDVVLNSIRRSVLSADPSHTTDFVLVVVSESRWLCWRPGDLNWTHIESYCWRDWADAMYYDRDQRFYAVDEHGFVYAWNAAGPPKAKRRFHVNIHANSTPYLAQTSGGELLIITRRYDEFRVYQLESGDEEDGGMYWNRAIYVGGNNAASFVPLPDNDHDTLNSVYFTHDLRTVIDFPKRDVVIYNLEDGSTRRICLGPVKHGSDFWVSPSSIPFTSLLHAAASN